MIKSLSVDVDFGNLQAVLATVRGVLEVDKVADEAAAILLNRTRQRYLKEVNPDDVPWIPSQAAIDRRRKGGTGTLFDTGTLWRSIQLSAEKPKGERTIKAGAYSAKGTEYGQFHQFGVPGRLPIREFLGVPQGDIELFEARMLQKIAEALNL